MMGRTGRLPRLIVFDLDACLWHPEMFELDGAPTRFDAKADGIATTGSDVVRLFPGARNVLHRLLVEPQFQNVQVGVASSTTEPSYATTCLENLPIDPTGDRGERVADIIDFREIYYGNKGLDHFPQIKQASGVDFQDMIFFDDCIYGDNCGIVARHCPGILSVRTPNGLTEKLFEAGLRAFADGQTGVL